MSRLSKKIQQKARQGRAIPAVVVDIFGPKVTIKLGKNGLGATHRLDYIGGPPEIGEIVNVDFTTDPPAVTQRGKEWLTSDDLLKALEGLLDGGLGGEFGLTILLFSGGTLVDQYPVDTEGFTAALLDANAGDVVYLYDVDIEGEFTIPDYVTVRGVSKRESILRAAITMGEGSSLENVCVLYGQYTPLEVVGVTVPSMADRCFIRHSEIHGYNCAGGNAVAIDVEAGGKILVEHSMVLSDAANGVAYAARRAVGGTITIAHSELYGKTDEFIGEAVSVYSNLPYESEIARGCILTGDVRSGFSGGNLSTQSLIPPATTQDPSGVVASPEFQLLQHSTPNYYRQGSYIIRNGDYVYFANQDDHDSNEITIIEHSLSDDTQISLTAGTYYEKPNTSFCAGNDRVIYVTYRETFSGARIVVKKLDFATQDVTEEVAWSDGDETGFFDTPAAIQCAQDTFNGLHILVYGDWYSEAQNVNTYTRLGVYVRHSALVDGEWKTYTEAYNDDIYGMTQYWYDPPQQYFNKVFLFPTPSVFISEDYNGNDLNNYPTTGMYVLTFWNFDLETKQLNKVVRELTGIDDWTGDSSIVCAQICRSTGEVFIAWENGDGSNSDYYYYMYRYNIIEESFTYVTKASYWYGWGGDSDVFIYDYDTTYMYRASDWSVLDTAWSPPDVGYDRYSRVVDDQDRIWYYAETDEKIYGVLATDDSDVLSITATKASLSDELSVDSYYIHVLRDMIGIFIKEGSTFGTRVHLWILRSGA